MLDRLGHFPSFLKIQTFSLKLSNERSKETNANFYKGDFASFQICVTVKSKYKWDFGYTNQIKQSISDTFFK